MPSGSTRGDVEEAAHELLLAAQRERERLLAAHVAGRREARAQRASRERAGQRRERGEILARCEHHPGERRGVDDLRHARLPRRGEVEPLEQRVDDDAARRRAPVAAAARRLDIGQPDHPLQVVAVGAALVLGDRGVGERWRIWR